MFTKNRYKEARFWRCAKAIELLSIIGMSDCENAVDFEERLKSVSTRVWANYCNLNKESKLAIAKLFEETAEIGGGVNKAAYFCGMQSLLNSDDDCGECNACGRR